jgi:hypothetical protein
MKGAKSVMIIITSIGLINILYYHVYLKKVCKSNPAKCDFMNKILINVNDGCCSYWPLSHFIMHFVLAFIYPETWPLLLVFGILWEGFEYVSGLYERTKKKDPTRQYSEKWWAPNIADLFLNIIGMLLGLAFRKLYDNHQLKKKKQAGGNTSISGLSQMASNSVMLNIIPRRMWGWGLWADTISGYCGEGSIQTCMISFGNYISQEQVLKAAGSPLLLGVNSDECLKALHVSYEYIGQYALGLPWILDYIKKQLDQGFPVIMGLYVNESDGDVSYDHICPIVGYKLGIEGTIENLYLCDGYLLYTYELNCLGGDCYQTRDDMIPNLDFGGPYFLSIPNIEGKKDDGEPAINQMVTIKGNEDPKRETFPVCLVMESPYEPNWGSEDQLFAPAGPIACTCEITGLTKGLQYSIIRFDNPSDLPSSDFLASGTFTMRENFTASDNNFSIHVSNTADYPFISNGTYFFRCVLNTSSTISKFPLGTNRTSKDPFKLVNINNTMNVNDTILITKAQKYKARLDVIQNTPMFNECDGLIDSKTNDLSCGQSNYPGSIAKNWKWVWPTNKINGYKGQNYGCMVWKFELMQNNITYTVAPVCALWKMTCKHPDLIGEDSAHGTIGMDGRLYIDCMDNPMFMSFSLGPAEKDGSFRLLSQDGVTYSTLTPIKD